MRHFQFPIILVLFLLALNCRGPEGPAGPSGGSGIESLVDPAIQPQVMYMYPPMNSTGPYDDYGASFNQVQIRFNKIMDRPSVKHAVSLSSPGSSARIDTSQVYSLGGDMFLLYIRDSLNYYYNFHWDIGRTYTLTIDSTVKDGNGNFLNPSFATSFTPEPYFRVKAVAPSNGATEVPTYTNPVLQFNAILDPASFSSIQISPSSQGHWSYSYDSTAISYTFDSPWEVYTTYSITVGTSAHDKRGHYLSQPFQTSFRTQSFRILYIYPQDGSTNVPLYSSISMSFSGLVDTGSVRGALSIIPPTPGVLNLSTGSTYVSFMPMDPLLLDTVYQVSVSTSVQSSNGVHLDTPYSFSFRTVPFAITSTYPSNGGSGYSPYLYSIEVDCSALIDTGSVRASFTHPGISGNLSLYDGANNFYLYPSTPLSPNTTYTLTIASTMRSKTGKYLKAPYTFSFTTGS